MLRKSEQILVTKVFQVVLAACSPALYDTFVQGEREAHSRPQSLYYIHFVFFQKICKKQIVKSHQLRDLSNAKVSCFAKVCIRGC